MAFRARLFISLLVIVSTVSSALFYLHRESLRESSMGAIKLQSEYTARLISQFIQNHKLNGRDNTPPEGLSSGLIPIVEAESQIAYLHLSTGQAGQDGLDTKGQTFFEYRSEGFQQAFDADTEFCIDMPYFQLTKHVEINSQTFKVDIALDMSSSLERHRREEGHHIIITLLLAIAAIGLGFWLFSDYITGISRLNRAVKAIEDGHLKHRVDTRKLYELKPTAEAFNRMTERLAMVASEQKSLYEDLLEKDRRLELILNNTEEAILGLDAHMDIKIANSAALSMLEVEQLEDLSAATAFTPEVLMEITDIQKSHKTFHFKDQGVINTKGSKVPVEIRGSQLSLKNDEKLTLVSMRNLTAEKIIQNAYEEQNSLKAALMDASLDSILLLDSQGENMSYNISMFNLMARLNHEQTDMNILQVLNIPEDTSGIITTLDDLELVNTGLHSFRRFTPRGEELHLEFNIQAFETHGHLYYTLTIRDITQKVKNQAKLEQAIIDADIANIAKTQFLAAMSHEIRTPLNGIQGSISLLAQTILSPDQKELLHAAEISSVALMQLINDILDFAKIEAGKMELETLEVSLQSVLQEAVTIISPRAGQKPVQISLSLDPKVDHCVLCDGGRLRQICLNLLANAVKFTDSGTIRLSLTALPGPHPSQQSIRILIEDPGIGISKDKQVLLFNEFTQANQSDSRRHGGTGLGLAISQKLAELMGGYIIFSSEIGVGSSFALYLSLPTTTTRVSDISQASLEANHKLVLPSKRILIVEDSITNQMIASRMLAGFNQQYEIACDGREALETLKERPFDLVLMDLQMPEMDGYEATEAIRNIPELQGMPIIAMTANVMTSDKERCFSVGMNDFLPKPVTLASLEKLLCQWLINEPSQTKSAETQQEQKPQIAAPDSQKVPALQEGFSGGGQDRPDNGDEFSGKGTGLQQQDIFSLKAIKQMEKDIGTERCLQMIEIVCNELNKRSQTLLQSYQSHEYQDVQHQAHTLKSTSASFGLLMLSELSRRIEHHYRFGDDDIIDDLIAELPGTLETGIMALENYREMLRVD